MHEKLTSIVNQIKNDDFSVNDLEEFVLKINEHIKNTKNNKEIMFILNKLTNTYKLKCNAIFSSINDINVENSRINHHCYTRVSCKIGFLCPVLALLSYNGDNEGFGNVTYEIQLLSQKNEHGEVIFTCTRESMDEIFENNDMCSLKKIKSYSTIFSKISIKNIHELLLDILLSICEYHEIYIS